MKRLAWCFFSLIAHFSTGFTAESIAGFWKTINENTHRPESIVAIYPFQGQYFGRIILTYDDLGNVKDTMDSPSERAPGVAGHPYYAGLDIIFGLKDRGDRFADGEILDPEHGKVYGAELWKQGDKLIVRGKLWIFGRNQTWEPASQNDFPDGFTLPKLEEMTPKIYR